MPLEGSGGLTKTKIVELFFKKLNICLVHTMDVFILGFVDNNASFQINPHPFFLFLI